jgi:hypothetical protein
LLQGKSSDGEFSKPVESPGGGHPDIAFTIFEKAEDDVTREAIRSRKYIRPAVMYMDEPTLNGSNPEARIAVPEQFIGIDFTVPEQSIRSARACNGIGFDFVAGDSHKSCAVSGNQ